MLTILLQMQL